jgi:hypothetical protein
MLLLIQTGIMMVSACFSLFATDSSVHAAYLAKNFSEKNRRRMSYLVFPELTRRCCCTARHCCCCNPIGPQVEHLSEYRRGICNRTDLYGSAMTTGAQWQPTCNRTAHRMMRHDAS